MAIGGYSPNSYILYPASVFVQYFLATMLLSSWILLAILFQYFSVRIFFQFSLKENQNLCCKFNVSPNYLNLSIVALGRCFSFLILFREAAAEVTTTGREELEEHISFLMFFFCNWKNCLLNYTTPRGKQINTSNSPP